MGKTSGIKTINAFKEHIKPKSTLIHDKEKITQRFNKANGIRKSHV
jgi:hypothetical protein